MFLGAVDPADAAYQQLVNQWYTVGASDQNPGAWPITTGDPSEIVNVTPTSTTYIDPATGKVQQVYKTGGSNTSSLLLLAGAVALAVMISK